MIKNHILFAFRNFYKHKVFVIINILGIGVSLACVIVAYLNNEFEAEFNAQHKNLKSIYKVNIYRQLNDREQRYGISPITLGAQSAEELPWVEQTVRYTTSGGNIKYGDDADSKVLNQSVGFADIDFFRMFTYPVKSGSVDQFVEKGSIVITDEMAQKFFGDESPLGKILTLFNHQGEPFLYNVIAVIEDIPLNSMVRFDAILPIDNYKTLYELDELDWKNWIAATFLLIPNSNDVSKVEGVLAKYIPIQNKAREDWKIVRFEVQSLRQYTKESRDVWANWLWVNLHPAQRLAPAIMAILILLLACFNFMNTSISVANTRVKEIGIRKVVGSRKTHLIVQFIGENTLICLMALIVSILFAFFLLDEYNSMWSYMVLKMSFTGDIGFWIFLFILLIFTSIAAGAYPAFYLSSFNPVEVLRGVFRFKGAGKFSQVLLGFQMVISLVALISSIIFTQNAEYQDKFDMGYNVDGIIVVPLASGANYEALKSACISNPDIIDISGTSMHIGWGSYPRTIEFQGKKMETRVLDINSGYLNTMGLKLLEGRSFEPEFEESDPFKSVVVSELFVQELGITDPLNKIIRLDSLELIIVGVSKNYYNSLWDKLYPTIFISRGKDTRSVMVVRTHAEKEKEVKEFLKGEWEKLVPNSPFFGREQTEILREAKDVNKNIKNINLFLAFTAIVLSLIALYTLVSLNIIKRTKEIGVRIVMGSKGMGIVWLISRPFLIILAISSVLGGLGGYYLNSMLLKSLWVFHTPINMASITIPVLILFGVSFAIISVRVYILLLRNPIESLRYE